MDELRTANEVLGDPRAMQERMERDGYLFFRDVIDRDDIARTRDGVMAWCHDEGLVAQRTGTPTWSGVAPQELPLQPESLHATGHWQWLAGRPSVQRIVGEVLGGPGLVLPITEYHFTWPGKPVHAGIHQDGVYSHGMGFTVFWIPLVEVDAAVGGIAIAQGQHARGPLHPVPGASHPYIPPEEIPASAWARADYRPGDLLAIGRWTPHVGQPNTSDILRLSIDFRALPEAARRPVIGLVTRATDSEITVQRDDGGSSTFRVDGDTVIRVMGAFNARPSASDVLGRSVIVTHEDGTARLIRPPHGNRSTVEVVSPWSDPPAGAPGTAA